MNLILTFVHPARADRNLGPFQAIRLDAGSVRDAATERVLAEHANHQWVLEGERYSRLDATTAVRIHFERRQPYPRAPVNSRGFGPYERFSAIDGVAYADDRLFAFVDAKAGDWFCYEDGHHWTVMVVSDAGAPRSDTWTRMLALAPYLAGVIGLWQDTKLVYLGRADSIRARLATLAETLGRSLVTSVTWETHANPAARETELLAEYAAGSASLVTSYGRMHGRRVRTRRLIERAMQAVEQARSVCAQARLLRRRMPAAA
jgi:hypothetical protein